MAKKFRVTAVIWREGRQYVSKCPELGVASHGRTPDAARRALEEAVELYIENAGRLGLMKELMPMLTSPVHYTSSLEIAS